MAKTFTLDVRKFVEKVKGRETAFVQKLCFEIVEGVVFDTPVDKGQARGGWNVGVNNVNLAETQEDKTGNATIAKNAAEISKAKAGDVVYISNNVGHIVRLEEGSSKQAPNGMVAVTLRRFSHIVGESIDEAKKEIP